MKLCSASCMPACDFCEHYLFNGEDLVDDRGILYADAVYTGNGWCMLHNRPMDPGDMCADFSCTNLTPAERFEEIIDEPYG